MKYLVVLGRILYAFMFIFSVVPHFSPEAIAQAESQGVPMASLLVPLSGIMACLGGLSIAVGYKAKWGAWLIAAFLIPVTLMMHNFWATSDPMMAMMHRVMFFKNTALVGAALLIAYFGAGPLSIDQRMQSFEALRLKEV